MVIKNETLDDIGFAKIQLLLLAVGYRIGDLFHMNGHLDMELIRIPKNEEITPSNKHDVLQCGTVRISRIANDSYHLTFNNYGTFADVPSATVMNFIKDSVSKHQRLAC